MATYTCNSPKCLFTTRDPFCPQCNQFLTDDLDVCESVMKPPKAPEKLEWCTAFGHWGDVFMCCGLMKNLMRQTGQEKVNVLYAGPDMDVVSWLKAQAFVDKVCGIEAKDNEYRDFWGATTQPSNAVKDWAQYLKVPFLTIEDALSEDGSVGTLPTLGQITQTHVNHNWFQTKFGLPAQMWTGGELPNEAHVTAHMLLREAMPIRRGQVYHLHPVSTWSELAGNHWPHWAAAIEFLIEKTPHTYLLTGLEKLPFLPKSPRLIDLTGETESNLEVLAMSDFCDGVISTPNSIAHWSVVRGHRCLCVGNKATEFLTSYYRRFLQRGEKLTYLNVDTSFSGFQGAACAFFEDGETA